MSLYTNIEKDTIDNTNYRKVISTTLHDQVVLMSLEPGEDIPLETHDGSQFIRFEKGKGRAVLAGKEYELSDGISLHIPAGMKHYIQQTGNEPLKLYAVYSPPEHPDGLIQPRQQEYIENVPADILRLTYDYLDDPELARACLVNKDFNKKLCNSKLWIQKIIQKFGLTSKQIDKYKGNNTYISYYLYLNKHQQMTPQEQLLEGAKNGRADLAIIALKRGANPDGEPYPYIEPYPHGDRNEIPAKVAAIHGNIDVFNILVKAGAKSISYKRDSPSQLTNWIN